MKTIVITIGDELLTGHTVDTNSAWMGVALNAHGFSIARRVTIRDERDEILKALHEALAEEDIVLLTGGLGPTNDDITKKVLCEFFESELILHNETFDIIKDFIKRRGYPLTESNRNQAMVPKVCTPLINRTGTAPGMWFDSGGKVVVSMPGVPYEMEYLMLNEVIPRLAKQFEPKPVLHRWVITHGISEAFLSDTLQQFEKDLPQYIRLAYLPTQGVIKLRLSVYEADLGCDKILSEKAAQLRNIISEFVIGEQDEPIQQILGRLLKEKNKTLALAESCTGGYIAHLITQIAGSSAYFKGGVVAYSNEAKINILGVNHEIIEKFGAVSVETATEMAACARNIFQTDYALATTGIAGPDGATPGKPVGTVCLALASSKGIQAEKFTFGNQRLNNVVRSANTILAMLIKELKDCQTIN